MSFSESHDEDGERVKAQKRKKSRAGWLHFILYADE